ncbi:hypothetical protein EG328_011732 [Venturia inaequalis]|uniref:Uncharacterized protein n=1 Tax=Venturia inaequalis TaxID=5025 RepID=A0A8H3U3E3_VENIN|nr:hypothetical protein EG328_011732 [Venturia inaequalis]
MLTNLNDEHPEPLKSKLDPFVCFAERDTSSRPLREMRPPVSDKDILTISLEEPMKPFVPEVVPDPETDWPLPSSLLDTNISALVTGAFDDEFVNDSNYNHAPTSFPVAAEEDEEFVNELAAAVAAAYPDEDNVPTVNDTVPENDIPVDSAIPQEKETVSSVYLLSLSGLSLLHEAADEEVRENDTGSDGKDHFSRLPDELVKKIFGFYMVDMPMPQREYPTIYRISGVFDDAADALKAIRGMQKNDRKSHLAIDILQKWIPAYVEESRKYMLHEFRMNQTAATSKELLNKIHEPYVSPYIARQIAIQIHFDGAQTTVQEYVGAIGQAVPSRNVIDIRETDLDPLKEFLEKFNDVERATVQWHPQRPKMREFRINGLEQTVTHIGRVISWKNEKAKAKHYEHLEHYWQAKRKREALAAKAAEEGN